MTISQSISTLPSAPDRDGDTPAEFSDKVDALLLQLIDLVEEENAWAGQANTLANDVNADAGDAKTYRDEAQSSQNATLYDNGVTYNYDVGVRPDTVIGSNGHAYRCLVNGTIGDNPVGSGTGHWAQITVGSTEIFEDQVTENEYRMFAFSLMF